nr:YdcF family protein [Candidatus Enterousia merdequi]
KKHIRIESLSKSTYQNTLAIKNIVEQEQMNRIVIVTTEDHMNRAMYLLHQTLPNTDIIACPASLTGMPAPVRVKRWAIEYLKYLVTLFGIKEN